MDDLGPARLIARADAEAGQGGTDEPDIPSLAEHALAVGKANPAGLFAWLVRNRAWRYPTAGDEDRANARLKARFRGPEPPRVSSAVTPSRPGIGLSFGDVGPPRVLKMATAFPSPRLIEVGLSDDARFVWEIRSGSIRAGVFRDPFPTVQARDLLWTRERWDRAMGELGLA